MRLLLIAAFAFGSLLAAGAPPVRSAPAAAIVDLTVRVGFGGVGKLGGWVPVDVFLVNQGDNLTGELQVRPPTQSDRGSFSRAPVVYAIPVSLPARAEKRFSIPVFVAGPGPNNQTDISVALVSGDQTISQQASTLTPAGSGEVLCGVLARDNAISAFLSRIELPDRRRPIRAVDLVVGDLPGSAHLLSSLDCLVIGNVPLTSLLDDQKRALGDWVGGGGLLVLAAGSGTPKLLASLPEWLPPVKANGMARVAALGKLEEFTGQPLPARGNVLVPAATLVDGTTVVEQDGVPVVVAARRGQGGVVYLGLDPTAEPFRSWAGEDHLWKYAISHSSAPFASQGVSSRPQNAWGRVPRTALSALPPLEAPPVQWPVLLFSLYVLLVGPVNFLILRSIGRLHWSWITVPLLIAVATAVSFQLAATHRVRDIAVSEVSVVRSYGDVPGATRRSYLGVFTPRPGDYQFTFGNGLPSSLFFPYPRDSSNGPTDWLVQVRESGSRTQASMRLDAGALGTLTVDGESNLGRGFAGDLVFDGERVVGSVSNGTDRLLTGAALVLGRSTYRIGDVPAGGSVEVSLPIGRVPAAPDVAALVAGILPPSTDPTPSPVQQAREDMLQSLLNPSSLGTPISLSAATLFGWLEGDSAGFETVGGLPTVRSLTLAMTSLPLRLQPGLETELPTSLLDTRQLIGLGSRSTQPGVYDLSSGGLIVLDFVLPVPPPQFEANRLLLYVYGAFSGNSRRPAQEVGEVRLFNWAKQDWDSYVVGFGPTAFDSPAPYISALGNVRVLYSFRAPTGTNYQGVRFDRFELTAHGRAR